jgi:hypothetical protein
MVAAAVLKTAVLTDVWVRLPPPAPAFLEIKSGGSRARRAEPYDGLTADLTATEHQHPSLKSKGVGGRPRDRLSLAGCSYRYSMIAAASFDRLTASS